MIPLINSKKLTISLSLMVLFASSVFAEFPPAPSSSNPTNSDPQGQGSQLNQGNSSNNSGANNGGGGGGGGSGSTMDPGAIMAFGKEAMANVNANVDKNTSAMASSADKFTSSSPKGYTSDSNNTALASLNKSLDSMNQTITDGFNANNDAVSSVISHTLSLATAQSNTTLAAFGALDRATQSPLRTYTDLTVGQRMLAFNPSSPAATFAFTPNNSSHQITPTALPNYSSMLPMPVDYYSSPSNSTTPPNVSGDMAAQSSALDASIP